MRKILSYLFIVYIVIYSLSVSGSLFLGAVFTYGNRSNEYGQFMDYYYKKTGRWKEISGNNLKDTLEGERENDRIQGIIGDFPQVRVNSVIDGVTFSYLDDEENEIRVRLIGVETDKSEATEFISKLILNKRVALEFDEDLEDDDGNKLAYVYLLNGKMLQNELIENKLVKLKTVQPNTKHTSEFIMTENCTW